MRRVVKAAAGRGSLTAILILVVVSLAVFVCAGLAFGCGYQPAAERPHHTLSVPDRTESAFRI